MTVFPINLISNDFVHTIQCGLGGYEDAISPEVSGANFRALDAISPEFTRANSRALDSSNGKFIILD
jgi:hypothetical protein